MSRKLTPTPQSNPDQTTTKQPPLRHVIHHIEPDGTIHTLCGLAKHPARTTIAAHLDKAPCPACTATRILMETTE